MQDASPVPKGKHARLLRLAAYLPIASGGTMNVLLAFDRDLKLAKEAPLPPWIHLTA